MRLLTLSVMLVAAPAFAQSWGGYVSGWSDSAALTGTWTGHVGGYRPLGAVGPQSWGVRRTFPAVPMVVFPAPVAEPRDDSADRERAAAEAVRAERLDADRRLAEERERLAVERQRDAERRQHEAELRAREAEERERIHAARQAAERALAEERERLAREQAELEARQRALASVPSTPGNDVYRWTDDEGVTHYSTRVPPEMKGRARLVGGPSR